MPEHSDTFDVHIPGNRLAKFAMAVASTVVSATIIGTFAIIWDMHGNLAIVSTQQQTIIRGLETMSDRITAVETAQNEYHKARTEK